MSSPVPFLLGSSFRQWISAKGFWLVVVAALLPLVLTGAWAATHRADVAAEPVTWGDDEVVGGERVTFATTFRNAGDTGVGAFNVSLAVGRVVGGTLYATASEEARVEGLAPGASREVVLAWNATPGVYYVVATADVADELGEIDEYNNQDARPLVVGYAAPDASDAPRPPEGLGEDANATSQADLRVAAVSFGEPPVEPGENRTFSATIANAWSRPAENGTIVLRVGQKLGDSIMPAQEERVEVTIPPGGEHVVSFAWAPPPGPYWVEAWVEPPEGARDVTPADNHRAEPFAANVRIPEDFAPPEIPERLTIKEFYVDVLSLLHLRILLPLVALAYAAGVIADERERGGLVYLLTRPVPRWSIPLVRFAASFLVASVATLVGLLLTYALLFGTQPQAQDVGFLATPVLAALVALFVYGGLFTLMGTLVERPYLVGAAFVIGWENAAAMFVPWVRNLTVTQHLANALSGWPLDQGLLWMPSGEEAVRAVLLLLAAGAAFLVASSVVMKRREFAL